MTIWRERDFRFYIKEFIEDAELLKKLDDAALAVDPKVRRNKTQTQTNNSDLHICR